MFQRVEIIGNLGRDPESRQVGTQTVCNFSVATNRTYTNRDNEAVKETTWFRVAAWGRQAEVCQQYLHKGSKVRVEGRLIADPATGGPRVFQGQSGSGAAFEINASNVLFLSRGENGEAEVAEEQGEEIPF